MMAGHPNNANPTSLRNLPFAIFMGGEDGAYNRNTVARDWGDRLQQLQAADPEGYPHRCTIYEGLGHWMDGRDAEGLPWMAQYTRDPWPTKVVWHQSGRTHGRFAWLSTESPKTSKGNHHRRGGWPNDSHHQRPLIPYTLRLSDALVDLDRPIEIVVNWHPFLQGQVHRTEAAIRQSLAERFDPASWPRFWWISPTDGDFYNPRSMANSPESFTPSPTKPPRSPPSPSFPSCAALRRGRRGCGNRDISLAARISVQVPRRMSDDQRVADDLAELGAMCLTPEANIIKLPNISGFDAADESRDRRVAKPRLRPARLSRPPRHR